MANNNIKRLYRSDTDKIIFGVCGGLGEYMEIDPLIIRIIFIALTLAGGSGILIYLVLAILIPQKGTSKSANKQTVKEETGERAQNLATELKNGKTMASFRDIFGLIVVVIGIIILIKELFRFDIFNWINWGLIFALFLIFVGFRILSKQVSGK
jgi:phage shock protein C